MRQIQRAKMVGTAVFLLTSLLMVGGSSLAGAETSGAPSLVISQLKITSSNGQFVTLYNASSLTLDMSKYQLEYFNSYDLTKATSSRLIALTGSLPPHSYYMINDSTMALCYQLTVDSVSLGFSSTAGLVEVLSFTQNSPGASVVPGL
jgi:predicted extracellular nuclease